MMSTTPSGSYCTQPRAGRCLSARRLRCGRIHFFRCFCAYRISPSCGMTSPIQAVELGEAPLQRSGASARMDGTQSGDEVAHIVGSHVVEHPTITTARTRAAVDSPADQLPDLRQTGRLIGADLAEQ